ncbi:MAG: methyltransferase family protein [Armatimonadota bacterium]
MSWRLLRALILLPGSVMGLLPAPILHRTRGTKYAARLRRPNDPLFWLALLLGGAGLGLMVWTVRLFATVGKGTPAPWEPPKRLVVRGPYRYARNPMISGGQLILIAETLLFRSVPLAILSAFFFLVNALYFPLVEEKGLEARFGRAYRTYKAHVPRWIPRLRPWEGGDESGRQT